MWRRVSNNYSEEINVLQCIATHHGRDDVQFRCSYCGAIQSTEESLSNYEIRCR